MEIKYIEEFVVLAEICNYGRAADELYISQSSLFNHIKALETELEIPLFNRRGKSIVLSDYGQIFLPYARTIISTSKEYTEMIRREKGRNGERVRIGTQYVISDLIRGFREKHQRFEFDIFDSYNVVKSLDEGVCELAFMRDPSELEQKVYHFVPYLTDRIVLAVHSSHPLARKEKIRLETLKNEEFIMITDHLGVECYGMQLCKKAGFIPRVIMNAAHGNEAARMVNNGMGISLFLRGIIASEDFDNLVMIELEPPTECSIMLGWRKDRRLSEGARLFVDYVREQRGETFK